MLMWWAVFFVSGYGSAPGPMIFPLFSILIVMCLRFRPVTGERFVFFLLCASTSMVIWTASSRPAGQGSRGALTGGVPGPVEAIRERVLDSLADADRVLIVCVYELYGGSWSLLRQDLLDRLEGRPYVLKLGERIRADLDRANRLEALEKELGIRFCDYVTL